MTLRHCATVDRQIFEKNVQVFRDIIAEGVKNGSFNKDADEALLVATIFGTKNYIVNTPHITSKVIGYDVMDQTNQNELLKPRFKLFMKQLLKAYLQNEHNENDNK